MSTATHPTSIRLSKETLALLDQRARETKRSRSFLVEQAVRRHLAATAGPIDADETAGKIERLRAFKGVGAKRYGPLSSDEIDVLRREFSGDDE
ncbi:ribbon-helix-helix protein, CopG family [Shinella sp. BYT-45]|uniref:ribbon-helix-helix protein, CopG family n=1 Tax=Shinella sp. BYT-45 TaxID=3377377 RepID=UPI00397ED202